MVREAELGVMDGDESFGTEFRNGLTQVFGHSMDLAPVGVVLTVLHDGEVDIGKLFPEALETTAIATVAREKHLPR